MSGADHARLSGGTSRALRCVEKLLRSGCSGQAGERSGRGGRRYVTRFEAVELIYTESVADAVRDAGATDDRLSASFIAASVRRVIAAWVTAAEGDEAALAAVARPEAVQLLLHSTRAAGKRTKLVCRGLRVTSIMVDRLQVDAKPPALGITFGCAGRRYIEDLDTGSVLSGDRDADSQFVQFLYLALDGSGPWSWRVYSGDTRTLTPPLGWTFSCRSETPQEYRERTGALTAPADGARQVRHFQIRADFAEHDERIGASVAFVVERDTEPTREEAEHIAFPAMVDEITRIRGQEGDWRPALSRLEVRELLD
jgi:hypothetical protein